MILDGRGVGEQAVDRDQGRKGGKEPEQAIEGHAGCDRQDAVFVDLLIDAPEDVLPALGGALGGGGRLSSTTRLPAGFMRGRGLSLTAYSLAPLRVARPGPE